MQLIIFKVYSLCVICTIQYQLPVKMLIELLAHSTTGEK